jgi:membrane-bound lytic murein transglycosylase B
VWQSVPDAMYSAANYLQREGWQANEPVAFEVRLPQGFDWRKARLSYRRPVAEWTALGVLKADASPLPAAAGSAAIVLPQGWKGPAFMVFDNFDVVRRWNRSTSYALSVAQLAQQLAGGAALVGRTDEGALGTAQLKTLQQSLNELGFDAGTADGMLGPRTQTAIRIYQDLHQLPVDGYPSPEVLANVERAHAAAAAAGKLKRVPAPTFADPDDSP